MKWIISISNSTSLIKHFESFFYWEGKRVSQHAVPVLIGCLILTGLGAAGLPFLHAENNMIKLWIPQTSDFALNYNWLWRTHPPEFRDHSIILHGDDVLTPEAIQKMYEIYKSVYRIRTQTNNGTWNDLCFRRPVVKITDDMLDSRRRKRDAFDDMFGDEFGAEFEEEFSAPADFSLDRYPHPYCEMVESLDTICFHETLLELWADDGEFNEKSDAKIAALTKSEILKKINDWGYSELYLAERDFSELLGGVTKDENGKITGARAVLMKWMGKMNSSLAIAEGGSNSEGTGEMVDSKTAEFETKLSQVLLEARDIQPTNIKVEVNVANSFGTIASDTILTDVNMLIVGFALLYMYVNLMLGKFNLVEQRAFVSLMGLASVWMGIAFSYGVCGLLGLPFGPLHNIIPFLLLGIGIDDMFVTVECFNNLNQQQQKKSLHERMGLTMKKAGCAITITSVTDFLAFMIGGTTVLPALQSFCIFCAIGIIMVYVLQATWFFAWFSLDQRRIEDKRNGTIPCFVHKNYTPNSFSQKEHLKSVFKGLSNVITTIPAKILILLATAGIFGVSVWGNIELKQEFNPIWFLPPESYLAQWHAHSNKYFPSRGEQVTVFFAGLDLPGELHKMDDMHRRLGEQTDIVASVDSWYNEFKKYTEKNFLDGESVLSMYEEEYHDKLTQFLYSPIGSKYRFFFTNDGVLTCGEPAPTTQISMMSFQHHLMSGPEEQIPAMNRVKQIIKESNFSGRVFPLSAGYASWETDEVISHELYRNMALAVLCIFLTTWILLFNFIACTQVLVSVVLTLVNVAGFMHFWGLTIDTVSCTNLIIAIGLCVDYSAHIAHAFMTASGDRNQRARAALSDIGPAVFNGGFSTFLAFVLLAFSRSHVFSSFFKIFFLVVVFGLYNGLIFLPVILSLLGPRSYNADEELVGKPEENEPLKPIIKTQQTDQPNPANATSPL